MAWMAAGLVAYTSAAAHGCLPRAMEMAGLGRDALRMIPCDAHGRMRLDAAGRHASRPIGRMALARSWWSAPPERSISARSTT